MKPEDKKKLQDAWRKAVNSDPNADKASSVEGALIHKDGTPVTPRSLMEAVLASEEFYKATDKYLAENPTVTLDQIIESNFGPQKKAGPKI